MSGQKLGVLLERARALDPVSARGVAAILGACVADAASRPLHWVYDQSKLKEHIKGREETPEFLPESKSPFYSLPTGENSCYFDQAHSVLKTLAEKPYSYEAICQQFVADFGPGTAYDLAKRQEFMKRRSEGNMKGPVPGKWIHGGMIGFLERYGSGAQPPLGGDSIKETDGFCISVPVIALYPGTSDLDSRVDQLIKTLSTMPRAVTHGKVASKILEAAILDPEKDFVAETRDATRDGFPDVARSLDQVYGNLTVDHVTAVQTLYGSPCYNPGSFQGALHAYLTSQSFEEGIRKSIRAGGCNCSRALFCGAISGAKYGLDGIPRDWIEKTTQAENVLEAALKAVGSA